MRCPNCNSDNPSNAKFCNQCGSNLQPTKNDNPDTFVPEGPPLIYFGIFTRGGYGDGYSTSFGFETSPEQALKWLNSPASLSLFNPNEEYFLGKVSPMSLFPTDPQKMISERFNVHEWYKLIWNDQNWEIGEKLSVQPSTIGLSPLE